MLDVETTLGNIVKSEVLKSKVPKQSQDQRDLGWHQNHMGHRMAPLTHLAKKIDQVDSEIKDVG